MKRFIFRARMKLTGAITLLVCLFFLAGAAHAVAIYVNLDSNTEGIDSVGSWGPPLFNSFSVGQDPYFLTEIQLLLERDVFATAGNFSVYLCIAGPPGSNGLPPAPSYSVSDRIDTFSDTIFDTKELSVLSVPLDPGKWLSPNTRYWVVLDSQDRSTVNWAYTFDLTGIGVAGEYCGYGTNVYSWEEGPYQMRLVPLPGTVWLLGSGLAGLGLWRLRRRFKA
jgi:hypothetical protein